MQLPMKQHGFVLFSHYSFSLCPLLPLPTPSYIPSWYVHPCFKKEKEMPYIQLAFVSQKLREKKWVTPLSLVNVIETETFEIQVPIGLGDKVHGDSEFLEGEGWHWAWDAETKPPGHKGWDTGHFRGNLCHPNPERSLYILVSVKFQKMRPAQRSGDLKRF